jgi:hypothetical protein
MACEEMHNESLGMLIVNVIAYKILVSPNPISFFYYII